MPTRMASRKGLRHYGNGRGLVAEFAQATGRTTGSANQRLYGNGNLKRELIEFVRLCKQRGQLDVLDRYMREIIAELEAPAAAPTLTLELADRAQEADGAEDVRERRYWQTRSLADLSMAIRAKDVEIATAIQLRDAMVAEERRLLAVEEGGAA